MQDKWDKFSRDEKKFILDVLNCKLRDDCSKTDHAPVPGRFKNCTYNSAQIVYMGTTPGDSRGYAKWDDADEKKLAYIMQPMTTMGKHLDKVTNHFFGNHEPYILINEIQCKFKDHLEIKMKANNIPWKTCPKTYFERLLGLCKELKVLIVGSKKPQQLMQKLYPQLNDLETSTVNNKFKGKYFEVININGRNVWVQFNAKTRAWFNFNGMPPRDIKKLRKFFYDC